MNKILLKSIITLTCATNSYATQFINSTCNTILISTGYGAGSASTFNTGHIGTEIQPGETKEINNYHLNNDGQISFWTTSTNGKPSNISKSTPEASSSNEFTYNDHGEIILLDVFDRADSPASISNSSTSTESVEHQNKKSRSSTHLQRPDSDKYKSIEFENCTENKIYIATSEPGIGAGGLMNSGYGGTVLQAGKTQKIDAYVKNNEIIFWTDSNTEASSPLQKAKVYGPVKHEFSRDAENKLILQTYYSKILANLSESRTPERKKHALKRLTEHDDESYLETKTIEEPTEVPANPLELMLLQNQEIKPDFSIFNL